MGWEHAPHLTEELKKEMWDATPPHMREARAKGIPSAGSGAIYPFAVSEITCKPFMLPPHWKRGFALDDGWNCTAALWFALDPEADVLHVTTEHYQKEGSPQSHATAILARGEWIPGVGDAAARTRDGQQIIEIYKAMGLKLELADKQVEAGIYDVHMRLATGRLKIWNTCLNTLFEYQRYHRDENGKIVKAHDHAMDCVVGATLVVTPEGAVPISELVGKTGMVRTLDGSWAPFERCQRYGVDRPVVDVRFDDGSSVRCTPDHLFLTDEGWKPAVDIDGMLCDTFDVCTSPSSLQRSKSLRGGDTISAESIFSATASACTSLSGPAPMDVSRQKATTSTTAITTEPTMSPATSVCSLQESTPPTITTDNPILGLPPPLAPQRSGTARPRGESGTVDIMPPLLIGSTPKPSASAISAASHISHKPEAEFDSAPTNANRNGADCQAWTMLSERVPNVVEPSALTATHRSDIAPKIASRRCVGVTSAGRADVYCLTVPGKSAFVLGNGVVIHNCLRYGCRPNALARMIAKPADTIIGSPRRVGDRRVGY